MQLDQLRIVFTLLALSAACSSGNPPPGNVPAPPQLAEPGGSTPISLIHNEYVPNALNAAALTRSSGVRSYLANHELNSDTLQNLSPDGGPLDNDIYDLVHYIVRCALDPTQSVTSPRNEPWWGELGLCADWLTMQPSPGCLQIVSSCVLARTNATGKKVIISVRGPDNPLSNPVTNDLFKLQTEVMVEKELRNKESIASFADCTGDPNQLNPRNARDCGWKPLYVGKCKANSTVTISPNSQNSSVMLRVCKGLYGCDHNVFNPTPYAGFIADGMDNVQFQCPANGSASSDGYFSVMLADENLASVPSGTTERPTASDPQNPVSYPAPESDVFTYREGAFYGNIFSWPEPPPTDPAVLQGDMYACHSDEWDCGPAYMADRFCGGAGSAKANTCDQTMKEYTDKCFGNIPQPCFAPPSGGVCTSADGSPPDKHYLNCTKDGSNQSVQWTYPITVYLNHPCDLDPDGDCDYRAAAGGETGAQ